MLRHNGSFTYFDFIWLISFIPSFWQNYFYPPISVVETLYFAKTYVLSTQGHMSRFSKAEALLLQDCVSNGCLRNSLKTVLAYSNISLIHALSLQQSTAQALAGPEIVSLCLIALVRFYPSWMCLITFWSQLSPGCLQYLVAMGSTSNCMLHDSAWFCSLWTLPSTNSISCFVTLALQKTVSNCSFSIFSMPLMALQRLLRQILSSVTQSWHNTELKLSNLTENRRCNKCYSGHCFSFLRRPGRIT